MPPRGQPQHSPEFLAGVHHVRQGHAHNAPGNHSAAFREGERWARANPGRNP